MTINNSEKLHRRALKEPVQCTLGAGDHFGQLNYSRTLSPAIISETVYKESTSLPKHSHELAFFTFVLDGFYLDKFTNKELTYKPMTVLWRKEGNSHTDMVGNNGGKFFFVEIENSYLDKLREDHQIPERFTERNGSLTWLATRLRNEMLRFNSSSPLIAEGITLELLGNLGAKSKQVGNFAPTWLNKITERLNDEFVEKLSIDELSREAGVHPVHLSTVFRRFHNRTVGEYVQDLRIGHATELLQNLDIPLAEIAISSGFSDQSHFTRIFKRRMGTTPGAYRKLLT